MIKANGFIRHGKLEIGNKSLFLQQIQDKKDQPVNVIIKSLDKRTNRQNRYWWGGVVSSIHENLTQRGYVATDEDVHELLKQKFNSKSANLFGRRKISQTTTKLNKQEFSDLVERVRDWASDALEMYIQTPHQYYEEMGIDYETGEIKEAQS